MTIHTKPGGEGRPALQRDLITECTSSHLSILAKKNVIHIQIQIQCEITFFRLVHLVAERADPSVVIYARK